MSTSSTFSHHQLVACFATGSNTCWRFLKDISVSAGSVTLLLTCSRVWLFGHLSAVACYVALGHLRITSKYVCLSAQLSRVRLHMCSLEHFWCYFHLTRATRVAFSENTVCKDPIFPSRQVRALGKSCTLFQKALHSFKTWSCQYLAQRGLEGVVPPK